MRNYMKPVVIVNSEVSEGVYAASGSADECYTVTAYTVSYTHLTLPTT